MRVRQHSQPFLVNAEGSRALQLAKKGFDENWLQTFIFSHFQVLPISEIEPVFGPLIPVCRELGTNAGPIDLVFANELGLLTLVECKLWENPEARRAVVGQILDYAKEISRWDYSQLDAAIKKARSLSNPNQSLFEIVSSQSEELDQSEFVDNVSRNLKRGRFLLLIVGNGIRESVELIAEFLQEHAHLNFSFSLVEMSVFQSPPEVGEGYFVQPRVIAQTVEIERAVIRIEGGQWSIDEGIVRKEVSTPNKRRIKISEQQFYDNVTLTTEDKEKLRFFLNKVSDMGVFIQEGQNSLKIRYSVGDYDYTLGVFRTNGTFQNFGIASTTSAIGHPEIGETYLNKLASLLKNTYVYNKLENRFHWTVKKNNNQPVSIAECLSVADSWLQLIQETISELDKTQGD